MPATVSSAFRTKDEVTPVLRKLRVEAAKTDIAFEALGSRIDKVGDRKNVEKIGKTKRAVGDLGSETDRTATRVGVGTRSITGSVSRMERDSNPRLERLRLALKRVELDPVKFAAEARIIKSEIRSIEQQAARSNLKRRFDDWGLAASDLGKTLGSGGAGAGGGGGGLTARMGAFSGEIGVMGVAMVAALPAVVGLTGALGALIGSLGAAVGGAGALGAGVFGAAIVGVGGLVSIIKPAVNEIKKAKQAQDAYNKAVQQYGDKSKQAIQAQRALDNSFKGHPGLRAFMGDLQIVQGRWGRLTRAGQGQLYGLGGDALGVLRRQQPNLARSANQSMTAVRSASQPILQLLGSPQFDHFLTVMTGTFAQSIVPFGEGMSHIAEAFMHISEAASPYVVQMFQSFDHMTEGWARGSRDAATMNHTVGGLVSQTKDWIGLMKATGNLLFAFFGSGARQGQGVVRDITNQFNAWGDWMRHNPQKMHDFFDRTIRNAKGLASALFQVAKEIGRIGDALMPVLNLITSTTSLLGGNGMLGPLGALGAYKYFTRGGGGGGSAGLFAGAGTAAAGARAGIGGLAARYGMARGAGGFVGTGANLERVAGGAGRLGALGFATSGMFGTGLRAAGKAALPITALMAAYDFASFPGSTSERFQNVAHGLTFGLVHAPVTRSAMRQQGMDAAQQYAATHSGAAIDSRVASLTQQLGGQHRAIGGLNPRAGQISYITVQNVTGKDRAKLQSQLDYLKKVQQLQREQKKILDQERENARRERSIAAGLDKSQQLQNLFGAETRGGTSVSTAFGDVSTRMLSRLNHMRPAGAKVLAQTYLAWAQQLRRSNPQLAAQIDQLVTSINHKLRALPGDAAVVGGHVFTSLRSAYTATSTMMDNETEKWREANSKALTAIQQQMVGILRAMGYGNASSIVSAMERYGKGSVTATSGRGVKGRRSDAVGPVGGVGKGNYTGDGTGVPWGGPSENVGRNTGSGALMGANPALGGYASIGRRFGLSVSSGLRPGAITSSGGVSLHASGNAIDMSNGYATPQELSFARFMASHYGSGLDELIHTPLGFGIKNGQRVPLSFWGPAINAQHYNHVHVGDRTPGGGARGIAGLAGMAGVGKIKTPQVGGAGAYHAIVQRAIDIASFAGQRKLDSLGAGMGLAPGMSGGGNAANQRLGRAMMLGMGWGGNQWPALLSLWNRESGWNANAVNKSSGAYGIPQSLGHGHPYNLGDPRAQIAWGLNYIRGRYGSPSAAWGHEQSVGWYGNGGSFRANKPTVIGVGDRQPEDIQITPVNQHGRRGPGGGNVYIGTVHVVNHRAGDIQRQLERELKKVVDNLNSGMTEDHAALMD